MPAAHAVIPRDSRMPGDEGRAPAAAYIELVITRMPTRVPPYRIIVSLALAGVLTAAAGCSATPAQPQDSSSATDVGEAFGALLEAEGVPGGVIAVRRDGETASYPTGVADEDGTPVTDDTLFAYRSVTKSFAVTALLLLAEDGVVDLDAPLPDLGAAPDTEATARELASMRSGVPSYSTQQGLIDLVLADPGRSWTEEELYGLVDGVPEVFPPGTAYEYSNTNTLMVGDLIAYATGEAWADVVAAEISAPLGLDSVVYPGDELPPEGTASPFQLVADGDAEVLPALRATAFGAAGGLYGTASDLAAWAEALGAGTLLSPATQQERLASFGSTADDPASPFYDEYGLGIGKIGRWIGHTGNGLGYQALAMYDESTGTAVAIVINATGENGDLPADFLLELEDDILAAG